MIPADAPATAAATRLCALLQVKDVALNFEAWEYDPKAAAKAANPDRRRKWLIPLVLLAQVALKLLLDRWGGGNRRGAKRGGVKRGLAKGMAGGCERAGWGL